MRIRTIILAIIPAVLAISTRLYAQTSIDDTLAGQVAVWGQRPAVTSHGVTKRSLLHGATRDLSLLDVRSMILDTGVIIAAYEADADELIIVREGKLDVSFGESGKLLGPGGVALFPAGEKYSLENGDRTPVTYYLLRFRSKATRDQHRAAPPFLIDWTEMIMKPTDKGESRQIFSQPVAWLGKIDMHATTLNTGEVSHPPHVHRAEEIILMRSGSVQEYIGGKYYPATTGDVIFLPSEVPHALENKSAGRCEYFALQWQL
ncbi:MAG: cupin domain-containing protein [Chitinophagaceae bacterium]|nr:cupin domain-containing protein [Chitinophagaceae bacterium]